MRSATKFDMKSPNTAAAAYLIDLKGDIRMHIPGSLCYATYVATLEPIDLPSTKMSYSFTFMT